MADPGSGAYRLAAPVEESGYQAVAISLSSVGVDGVCEFICAHRPDLVAIYDILWPHDERKRQF